MLATKIKQGVSGGLAGGVVFGLMMWKQGMLPVIGKMAGQPNILVGFLMHLMISALIGASFGVLLGSVAKTPVRGVLSGLFYGAVWWVLGPLTMMPFMMGMGLGVNWNATAAQAMLPSLFGHLIFGLILGFVYSRGENCLLARFGDRAGNDATEVPADLRAL